MRVCVCGAHSVLFGRRCSGWVCLILSCLGLTTSFVVHVLHVTCGVLQVLKVLLRSYQELETPDYISVCQVRALVVS